MMYKMFFFFFFFFKYKVGKIALNPTMALCDSDFSTEDELGVVVELELGTAFIL